MRGRFLVACLVCGLAAGARAQGAQDYLHGGAAKYIQGRNQEALIEVEEGLRRFPDDPQLKAMAGHLRKLKDQQKQDGQQGSSQGDQGDKEEQKQDQSQGEKDRQDQEKKPGEEDKPQEEKQDPEGQSGAEAGEEDKGAKDSSEAAAPVKPGEMSKEDAERLLNSVQDDEKKEHKNMQRRYRKKVEVEQDW